MKLDLYYYTECGFSRSVLNTITNLKIQDQIVLKNIRENPDFDKELTQLCGDNKVPTLVIDGKPMRESEDIKAFLVSEFM
ncbi:glutathione S-transferase N-terminal domain-containing protein [bacterium]|nr:glutathione S-transferase N-terminal domain-containing protein [bacterium]